MKNFRTLALAIFALLISASLAFAVTTVPLNTGYDHWWGTAYGTAPSPVGLPRQDEYWINAVPGTPAFAITGTLGWQPPISPLGSPSTWINFQNSPASFPGTNSNNTRSFIYRKCFCLQPGYSTPAIQFQLRADDAVAVWLNSSIVVPYSGGSFSGPPVSGSATTGFFTGSNCVWVLVVDSGGATGFNLNGTVTAAAGLLSTPAKGGGSGSYTPCTCQSSFPNTVVQKEARNDEKMIREIFDYAKKHITTGPAPVKRN